MSEEQVFYQCQRCGNCCRWPGFVRLSEEDVVRMAGFFSMTVKDFTAEYCDVHPDRSALILKNKPNEECIFLEGVNVCRVQEAKPEQCQGFPNAWQFDGWREVCEAIPVKKSKKQSSESI